MVCLNASTIDFFTYERRVTRAILRDEAPLKSVLTCRFRSSGTKSRAIFGMMVMSEVLSTIRISVSSEPDSKV